MNSNDKAPASGRTGGASKTSVAGSGDEKEYITTQVVCVTETAKGVLLKSQKTEDELWFPKSRVAIITGEYAQGAELTVKIAKPVIQQARQNKAASSPVRFTAEVLVTGFCTENRPKAIGVLCDADREPRWLPRSKIVRFESEAIPNKPVRLVVPAWCLKRADGSFPAWVKGAVL